MKEYFVTVRLPKADSNKGFQFDTALIEAEDMHDAIIEGRQYFNVSFEDIISVLLSPKG